MLLALDTSTNYASIALVKEQKLLAELSWDCGRGHSQELFQNVRWLLASRRTSAGELSAVAVATGPGSFNGVRVAVAAAKSLSFALQLPLYACSTLDVIGWGAVPVSGSIPSVDAADGASRVWALLEGGRGQLYAAQYPGVASLDGTWGPLDGYHVLAATELAERILRELGPERPVLFAGEARPETRAVLAELLSGRKWILFAGSLPGRRASWLAELALAQANRGEAADAMALEPLYLRRPAITRSSKFVLPPEAVEEANAPEATSAHEETGEETSHALRR